MTTNREETERKMQEQENLVNIDYYRKLIRTYMDLHDYNTALFWADKVLALSAGEPRDVYLIAQCMYMLKEFHRAAEFIKNRELDKSHLLCHYLAVRSLVEAREFQEAMNLLNIVDQENSLNGSCAVDTESILDDGSKFNVQGALHLLRGRVLEALDNRALASECYRLALQSDVHCFEAFNALVQHQMLTALEERQLLDSLPFSQQCDETEIKILRNIYEGFLKKFHANNANDVLTTKQNLNNDKEMRNTFSELRKICGKKLSVKASQSKSSFNTSVHVSLLQNQSVLPLPNKMLNVVKHSFDSKGASPANIKESSRNNMNDNSARGDGSNSSNIVQTDNTSRVPYEVGLKRLEESYDVIVSKAEKYFYNCEYKQCLALTDGILKKDPFHNGCLKVHISCLVEMCNYNKLFYLAHKLVDLYPEKAMSWYAVGCYYYVIGKSDPARRYLAKATSIDRLLGPAWLAYGHSFAVENEHDQAMAAYFKASQLMRGCHLPMLYIGLECGLTNNNKLADKFFQQAEKIAPNDPFVIHEMGVIAYHNHDYETAEKYFRDALSKITTASCKVSDCWEALLNNLGHTCRRNGNFEESVEFHKRALVLDPQNPSTYSAIGFVQALKGDTSDAVDSFHKALSLRRDDTFSTTMLSLTVEQLMEEALVIPDDESYANLRRHTSFELTKKRGDIPAANAVWANSSTRTRSLEATNMVDISNNPSLPANETCFEDMSMSMDE